MNQLSIVAILFIELHAPDGQKIDINPAEVNTVREPREGAEGHFAKGVKCLVTMTDGKFIAVIEPCDAVVRYLEGPQR